MRTTFLPAVGAAIALAIANGSNTSGQVTGVSAILQAEKAAKKADDAKTATAPKTQLPKLLQKHDFDEDGRLNVLEALEFHLDKAVSPHNYLFGYYRESIPKKEIEKIADWYRKVAALKDTSPEEEEVLSDISAMLYDHMKDKESIQKPLPGAIATFDKNKDRKISAEEAFALYEARTGIKLERKENGQVSPASFRKMIDTFENVYEFRQNSFKVIGWYGGYYCRAVIVPSLSEEYRKLYGPLPYDNPLNIIQRD